MKMDLNRCVVHNPDKVTVDIDATCLKVREMCERTNVSHENDLDVVEAAVLAVFKRFPNANITVNAMIGYVLTDLKVPPSSYSLMRTRVEEHIKRCTGFLYTIKKGTRGGISLMAQAETPVESAPEAP